MKKTIPIILIVFAVLATAQHDEYYVLALGYGKGNITVENITVNSVGGFGGRGTQPETGYTLKLISGRKVLHSFRFELPVRALFEYSGFGYDGNRTTTSPKMTRESRERASHTLIFPYFKDAERIDIYNPKDVKVLSVNVSEFAKICGDSICQKRESHETCPGDCERPVICGDSICDAGEDYINCPKDCEKPLVCGDGACDKGENYINCSRDCEMPKKHTALYILGGLLFVVLVDRYARKRYR